MRNHGLDTSRTVYAKQSKIAINAGAFHNDVVCVGAMNTLFYHELAFENSVSFNPTSERLLMEFLNLFLLR